MIIKSAEEARRRARGDAVVNAKKYLENSAPNTIPVIEYWVYREKLSYEQTLSEFVKIYGKTEEKTMHKIKLIIEDLISERDEG